MQVRWKKYQILEMLCTYINLVKIYYVSMNGLMLSQKFYENIMLHINKLYHCSLSCVKLKINIFLVKHVTIL